MMNSRCLNCIVTKVLNFLFSQRVKHPVEARAERGDRLCACLLCSLCALLEQALPVATHSIVNK